MNEDSAEQEKMICPKCGKEETLLMYLGDPEDRHGVFVCSHCNRFLHSDLPIDSVTWNYLDALFGRIGKHLPIEEGHQALWSAFHAYRKAQPVQTGLLLKVFKEPWKDLEEWQGARVPPQTATEAEELLLVRVWREYQQEGVTQEEFAAEEGISSRHLRRLTRKWEERGMVHRT